ncbi:MAG: ribosome silencing factor [Flavobacteriales bacterium]|nr:ribosome silencing factor [Flavobacteriales bacterium]
MKQTKGASDARLVKAVIKGIQEVKGRELVHMDLRGMENAVCGHMVICHGDSDTQVEAITRSVLETVRKATGEKPWHTEGERNAQWILIDYVDVVVHVFHRDVRGHYALEELWGDAARTSYENVA